MINPRRIAAVLWLVFLLLGLSFLVSSAQEAKPEAGKEAQKVIAVMPFANLTKDTGLAWLGEGIAETMTTKLSQVSSLTVVERTRLDAALREIALGQSGVVDDSTAARAGKMIGAATMVVGAFQKAGESVRLTARSVDVSSGKVLKASEATGKLDEIFVLEDKLAGDILSAHGLVLKPEELKVVEAKPTSSPEAYEMTSRAEQALQETSDTLQALVQSSALGIVVTDLEMPRMNGYELIASLRENPMTRPIPVLVITSRAGAKHRDRALKEGAAGFLTKPVQEDQFLSVVAQMIGAGLAPHKLAPVAPVS